MYQIIPDTSMCTLSIRDSDWGETFHLHFSWVTIMSCLSSRGAQRLHTASEGHAVGDNEMVSVLPSNYTHLLKSLMTSGDSIGGSLCESHPGGRWTWFIAHLRYFAIWPEPWHMNVHPFCGSRLVLLRRALAMGPKTQAITYMKIVEWRASCWTISLRCWIDNIHKQKVWNISVEFQNHLWIGIQNTLTDGWEKHKLTWAFGHVQSLFFLIFSNSLFFYSLYTSIQPPLCPLLPVRAFHIPPPKTPLLSPQRKWSSPWIPFILGSSLGCLRISMGSSSQ